MGSTDEPWRHWNCWISLLRTFAFDSGLKEISYGTWGFFVSTEWSSTDSFQTCPFVQWTKHVRPNPFPAWSDCSSGWQYSCLLHVWVCASLHTIWSLENRNLREYHAKPMSMNDLQIVFTNWVWSCIDCTLDKVNSRQCQSPGDHHVRCRCALWIVLCCQTNVCISFEI